MVGRPVERERKFSNSTLNNHVEQAVAVRSSIADARGTLQIGYENDSESEKQDRETEKTGSIRRHPRFILILNSFIIFLYFFLI